MSILLPLFRPVLRPVLRNPFDRASGRSMDAQIRALYANGEQGAWYDPSDMSTLFQDAAGTTPVTAAGQPVGRMLDKSGNNRHATEATTTKRPIYQVDGFGAPYLFFDRVDDCLVFSPIDLRGGASALGLSDTFQGQTQAVISSGAAGYIFVTGSSWSKQGSPSTNILAQQARQAVSIIHGANSSSPTVITDSIGRSGSGVQANVGVAAVNIFGMFTEASSTPFGGNLYGLIHRAATTSAAQEKTMRDYIARKMKSVTP